MSSLAQYVVDQMMAHLPFKSAGPEERRFCCPFCNENDYKLYVNPDREKFICFKCEERGSSHKFVTLYAQVFGITKQAAKEVLRIYIEADLPENVDDSLEWLLSSSSPREESESLPPIEIPDGVFRYDDDPSHEVFEYLLNRGFTQQDLSALSVYGVGDYDSFVYKGSKRVGNLRNRVIFPIYHMITRDLVSWIARATFPVEKHTPKYINAPGTELAKIIAPATIQLNQDIVVCEGYIDAIAIRRAGIPAYCSFGKKLSDDQVKLLKELSPKSVTVWFDQGADGSAEGVVSRLEKVFGARYTYLVDPSLLPPGKDTGDTMTMSDGANLISRVFEQRMLRSSASYMEMRLRRSL